MGWDRHGALVKPRRAQPLERLVDADPRYYDWKPDRELNPHLAAFPDRTGIGLFFDCPIHADCWVAVRFANPLDGGGTFMHPDEPAATPAWQRTGEDFATLTLSPSIRVLGGADGCEWHGFIRGGKFEHCGDSK